MLNRLIFAILLTVCWAGALSQPKLTLPPYRHFTLRDGLSQMQVMCMMQDSRGYIWVGTKAGLNCFNGEKFSRYTRTRFPQISNDFIQDIKEDAYGRIWASTNSGILRIDGHRIRFFPVESNPPVSITPGKGDRLWFMQSHFPKQDFQIGYIEKDSIHQFQVRLPFSKDYRQRFLHYYEPEDLLLLTLGSGLYGLKNNSFELIDAANRLIFPFTGSCQQAYYVQILDTTESYLPGLRDSDLKKVVNGKTQTIARIRNGSYTEKPELSDVLFYNQLFPNYQKVLFTPDSISYRFNKGIALSKMITDRDGHIWLGAEDGLFQLFDNGFTVYNKDILPQIWAVTEDKKGNFWFSSYLYGLYKLEAGNLKHFPNDYKTGVYDPYFHPVCDKRGRLFFPNGFGIVMVEDDRFSLYSEPFYLTTWYDSPKDLVWGGGRNGAVAFDANRKMVRRIDASLGLDVGNNILTIGQDSAGNYWLGGGKGVARYNWETNRLKNYNSVQKNLGAVTQCTDFTGRSWFGGKGGLFWYDAAADSMVRVAREEFSDAVNMVSTIDSTWLIASQPYGIYLLDLRKYYDSGEIVLHLFNEMNGFLGEEPGQDGAFTDSKGHVWMTTGTTLISLDPRKLKTGKNSLNVRIDKCNGEKLSFTSTGIALPRNQNSAVITLEAICFNRPNPVQYCWKMANDTTWSAWQEEDYIVLSGLDDELHTLKVRARVKGLPLDHPAETEIDIKVRLAIYRQAWFFPSVFAFISFMGIGFLIVALLRMKKASREAKMFQIQAIQSQMNPHFIFNVLASLQSMILMSNISKANDYLVKLADLIRGFLEASAGTGVLKSPKSNDGQVTVASELKLLKEFVNFQQVINPERFDFEIQIGKNFDPEKELIPPMLIQPFIENAIRHGLLPSKNKGLLILSLHKINEVLEIVIRDNGVGIEEAMQLIKKSPMRYTSRGSELTMNRVKMLNQLGFKIEIKTVSNSKNTSVVVKLYK